MTFGQRVAQKRKELGLSQEGLGEQLGVSRQAIYKWESDASLPEIDKLITLSKIFSVPVGWLLGVEEESEVPSQDQERLVEDVLSRYQAGQTPPRKSVWDKWSVRVLFALCGIMLALLVGTNSKIKEMEQQYSGLSHSINNVTSTVDSQINSITRRVEDILKSQNALTAEWSAQLASVDPRANTAAFDVRAVPRTYVEGMTAVFVATSGEETVELPVEPGEDHAFSGRLTCPLTDQITLSVVFLTGDKRETQWLEDFQGLYTETFPSVRLHDVFWDLVIKENTLPASDPSNSDSVAEVWNDDQENPLLGWNPEPPATLQVGLFRDQQLVLWYEGRVRSTSWNGVPGEDYAWYRTQDVELEPGHTYQQAAVYTDEYGRQMVYSGFPIQYEASHQSWNTVSTYSLYSDPADWEF